MNNKVIWLLTLILVLNTVISNLIINLLIVVSFISVPFCNKFTVIDSGLVVSFIIIGVNFKNEGILNE